MHSGWKCLDAPVTHGLPKALHDRRAVRLTSCQPADHPTIPTPRSLR